MNNRKKKIACLLVVFTLLLSYSPYFNNLFINLNLSAIQEEDISIETGFDVYEGVPYWYSGTFWDDADYTFAWTNARIEFEHLASGLTHDHSITDLDNSETEYPTNSSFSMVNGTHYQNGTLNDVDDDYHIFNSTYDKVIPEQPDNFTIGAGNSTYDGDLEIIDGNYTTFNSEALADHPAEYSFTDDAVGVFPAGWTDSGSGTKITEIIYELDGHRKVFENMDNDEGGYFKSQQILTSGQLTGTIEWWWRFTDDTKSTYIKILDGSGTNIERFYTTAGEIRYKASTSLIDLNNDQWYHWRFTFDCNSNTYDLYINTTIILDNEPFYNNDDGNGFKTFEISSSTVHSGYSSDLDAVDYSWSTGYYEGRNIIGENIPDLEIEVNMNLNSFSNLNELYLVYAYLTNISLTCNFSIYNFDDSAYDVIENDVNLAFVNSYFLLNSSYYNATNDVILSFVMSNTSEFRMDLERLLVRKPSYLNFSTTVNFDTLTNLLQMDINSYQRSNISQLINMSIWNYDTSSWLNLNGSSYITTFQLLQWINTTTYSDCINSNGVVSLMYYGVNITDAFRFELDALSFTLWRKTIVRYEETLYLCGVWGYRFVLDDGLGTSYNTTWIYFDVMVAVPNFHAISESDLTTRWILQNASLSSVEDFHDDINTDYWNLGDVSEKEIWLVYQDFDDSYTYSVYPDNNFGNVNNIQIKNVETYSYLKRELPSYLVSNYTRSSLLYGYRLVWNTGFVSTYTTNDFDEGTITWNNQPPNITYQIDTTIPSGHGWNYINLGSPYNYYVLRSNSSNHVDIGVYSTESANKPTMYHYISKNYFGDGYTYMQTNTTELISLKSKDYGAHKTLNSGDYFEVDFQTNSDSKIELILLKDGVVNKTLTLSQSGNNNFNRHTVKISVDESVEFDQLKVSSTFEDTDNVKVYDIKTYKYELVGDYADFFVGSKRDYEIYLTPNIYNLRINENGYEKININVTIPATGIKQYVYKAIEAIGCRITLFNIEGEYLQFEDYHVTINRSLNGDYDQFELVDTLFYADVGTYVHIDVYDRFDALIYSDFKLASAYVDLYLEVYSLKIRNGATEIVDYTLQNIDTSSSKSGMLFSDEIVEYCITAGNYSLDYTNYEDMYPREYNFNLTGYKIININSTYHTIYIGLFTYDGLGVDRDLVRFYINGERKDFGFNVIRSETAVLIVLDFFNNTLANETIDASAYSEYNIFVEIYSLIILNQFTYEDIVVDITQVGSGVWMTQIIPKQFGFMYRFLPNVEYNITVCFTNATLYSSRIVNLTDNSHIESFGVPSLPSEYPKEVYFGVYTTTGLGVDRDLLRFYIDGNRKDFGFNRIEDMIVTITVKDYFNTTLFNQMINTSGIYEYNVLITLYSLKIKNEAELTANYTLKFGGLETTGYILPEEIIEYQLSSNNYVFDYTNNEDNSFHTIDINLNENKVYIINSTYYTAYFGLFDQYNHRLDNTLFSFYLNGTRKDFGFIELSSEYYNITVYDWLNISVFNQITYLFNYTEYNIIITVFELQIRHLAQENSNFSLYETTTGNYINFSMSPDSSRFFMLSSSTYNVTWTNGENMQTSYYDITLDSNYILTLSSTYRGVYFALFTYDGLGINHDLVKFYINESRKDFGFNIMTSALAEIVVLDFFNTTLFNQTIDFSSLSEYNVFIEVYSLIILNQFTYEDIIVNITQVGSGIWLNHIIPKQFALSCRFTPNMNYTINVYYVNGSLYATRTINLTENNHIESFGFPSLPLEYPKDVYFSVYTGTGLAIDQLLLKFYIDGDRADFGFNTIENTNVTITVKDFFNTTLFNQVINTSGIYEYDILITIYSLKIKNEAELTANYTLRLGGLTETGLIISQEIIEYQLSSNNYVFEFTNNEDGSFHTININLNQDRVYIINSTYYNIFFSLCDLNLHIFHPYLYEFRLNGTIQDLGLIEDLQSDDYNITVIDRFGISLFDSIVNLRGLNEYRIDIILYELQIRHLARENSNLNLTEDISGNDYSFIMAPNSITSIIVGSADYTLNWTNGETGLTTLISIVLTEDRVVMLNTSYYNIYFSLFDTNLHIIDLNQYEFRLNGTEEVFGFIEDLITDDYSITVIDRFGISLFDSIVNLRGLNEYRIDISLYELQIRHLARENGDLTLSETTTHNNFNFSMSPNSLRSFILGSSTYNVTWLNNENSISTTYNINLNSDFILTLNTSYYNIFFSLYDLNLHTFHPYQYEFRLNGTIQDLGLIVDLQSDDYSITVIDRFGISLFDSIVNLRGLNEYRIDITLYELQIRHLARENSNLTLTEDISGNDYSFIMTPYSIKLIVIGSADYILGWTNGETGLTTSISVALTEDRVVVLNTSYYNIRFSLFDLNLHTIDPYQYVFRLNGTIQDFGLIVDLITDDYTITVIDRFGTSLFDSVVNLRGLNEYRIDITLYKLQIRHLATENGDISLYETIGHNSFNFSMAPDTIQSFILGSSIYNITWVNGENGVSTSFNINLNSDYILTLDSTYYNIYFSLYDQGGVRLDDSLFSLYINGSRKDFGFVELETNNTLILVQDYLNITVFNRVIGLGGLVEYNIIITVFELQIRHLAFENGNISLYETIVHNGLNFSMAPNTIRYFMLANSTYNVTWVNGENSVSTTYNITLDENYILLLKSTYYDVYIGLYNFYGLVNKEEVKFYINGTRADFGFNTIKSEHADLLVLDFFNSTLYNQVVRLEGLTEYSVFVQAYTLVVNNLYNNQSITIKITRGTITLERLIEAQGWTEFKLFANTKYEITSYIDGVIDEEKEVELDEEYKVVDFGFYSTEVPNDPNPFFLDFVNFSIFLMVMAAIGLFGLFLYFRMRYQQKRLNPQFTRKKRKIGAGTYDDRGGLD